MTALDERQEIAARIRSGQLRLLYVAPERLLADRPLEFFHDVEVSADCAKESKVRDNQL